MEISRNARVKWGAAAAFVVVFGGGMALGFALDRGIVAAPSAPTESALTSEPDKNDSSGSGWIIDQIEMGPEQRARVDSVLGHYGKRMTELQKSFHPRYRALVDSTNQALRALLDEEQAARYEELERERKAERDRQNADSSNKGNGGGAGK